MRNSAKFKKSVESYFSFEVGKSYKYVQYSNDFFENNGLYLFESRNILANGDIYFKITDDTGEISSWSEAYCYLHFEKIE